MEYMVMKQFGEEIARISKPTFFAKNACDYIATATSQESAKATHMPIVHRHEGAHAMENNELADLASDIFLTATAMRPKKKDISCHPRRHVALKIMYVGARFHGFAAEASKQRTVESELFMALEKTKLLIGDRVGAKYTRCGRTDKGVSANAQVVALLLRSNHEDPDPVSSIEGEDRVAAAIRSRSEESQFTTVFDLEEIDYVGVLNRALPWDIRILEWCYVPSKFHARFSCLSREYVYYLVNDGLDIEAMKIAASKFCGEHDFRNFCKMDADNVHNFRREIMSAEFLLCSDRWEGFELWMFCVKGTAFLWHQVRCMVAVLFMVGQKKEKASVVDDLLNIEKTPRKPQYVMAPELPLVLQTCDFQGLSFYCRPGSAISYRSHFRNLIKEHLVAVAMLNQLPCLSSDGSNSEDSTSKTLSHIPLCHRPTEPTYCERQTNLLRRKSERVLSS